MKHSAKAKSGQEMITSRENPWLKRFRSALGGGPAKGDRRSEAGECVGLEGPRLVEEGFRSGISMEAVLVCDEGERHLTRMKGWLTPDVKVLRCSPELFASVAGTESPQGIAGLARVRPREFEELLGTDTALVVVLAGVQDPGNVGTLVRSAEAFGATGAVGCHGTANPYGPKALRASAGSALRLPMLTGVEAKSLVANLRDAGLKIYAASAAGDVALSDIDLSLPCALVIGNEAAGVPAEIERAADARLRIPLAAGVDSLNAAVAGAVLLYETSRQRRKKAFGTAKAVLCRERSEWMKP